MIPTVADDEQVRAARAALARQIEAEITRTLHVLGESGAEPIGAPELRMRHKGTRGETIKSVSNHLRDQIEEEWHWQRVYPKEDRILFFEDMRKRCYDLYDKTNAWDTIAALGRAVSKAITQRRLAEASDGDRLILNAISQFMDLLTTDMTIYKALNRGNNHSVIASCQLAEQKAGEIRDFLDAGGTGEHPVELGSRTKLAKELCAEAYVLHEVYRGINCAAIALAKHEAAIRKYYSDHFESDGGPGDPAAGDAEEAESARPWPDHEVTRNLHQARHEVRRIIRDLDNYNRESAPGLSHVASERAAEYASRLNPWASLLGSVAKAYSDSKPMQIQTVQIRYCYPFAVKAQDERLRELSPALRKRVPGVAEDSGGREGDGHFAVPKLAEVLAEKLDGLDGGTVTLTALELTDFWTGAGEGMYGGHTAWLSGLTDRQNADDEWNVWIDLSRLENHCLCIERTLSNPTPHELYEALRCPADYSRDEEYRYAWTGRESGYWRGLDEFAHDVILVVAQGIRGKTDPEYIKGHFHIMVLVESDVSITELDGLYGAELLRTNVNRDAATLEEWVRYPVPELKGQPVPAKGNFGYKENSWSVLDDTAIFGVVGNPSWQAGAYLEAVQFAASWTPRLLLWNRELLQALDKEGTDLRQLEQTVRLSVAFAHAQELCRLRSDRRYLEWMMEAVGTTSVQEDLERRIHTVGLIINENEKKQQDRRDNRRNFFLGAITLFGVLNVSTFFAVLDAGDQNGFFKSHAAIAVELVVQALILVMVIGAWLGVERWKKT